MFDINEDTIVAPATQAGTGAISIIRLSGKNCFEIVDNIISFKQGSIKNTSPNSINYAIIKDKEKIIDEVLISIFVAPKSYTGENLIEISCHSSKYIVHKIIELIINQGARAAKPGEFTQRAFLNGKLDLAQAEAVADLISSQNKLSHSLAINQLRGGFSSEFANIRQELLELSSLVELELDFSEEDVEFANRDKLKLLCNQLINRFKVLAKSFKLGNAIKEGISVAIVGATNSGKSSLLNCLLQEERAIVSEIEGTTRDTIEEYLSIEGIGFRFIDTAGLRETSEEIEKIGINRSFEKLKQAFFIIAVFDINKELQLLLKELQLIITNCNLEEQKLIILLNKTDVNNDNVKIAETKTKFKDLLQITVPIIGISIKNNEGILELKNCLIKEMELNKLLSEELIITNARHYEALVKATNSLCSVVEAIDNIIPAEFLAEDLKLVLQDIGSITGQELISSDEILHSIFHNFCIGK